MEQDIVERIRAGIQSAEVQVSLDGNRAQIVVVSDAFATMSRVQKQQAVYGCIEDFIADGRLHAVSIRALTPAEA